MFADVRVSVHTCIHVHCIYLNVLAFPLSEPPPIYTYMHTHTLTCMRYIHTCIPMHILIHAYTCTRSYTCILHKYSFHTYA